jgi:hypothetical protein
MITRIRVKSRHIEFQLDGGGYGTMGDETSTSIHVVSTPKTNREKNLERELEREKDSARRRQLREELDDLRQAREREDARNRAEVADAEAQKEENIRRRRLTGGSRFNVRYREAMPDAVLTPEGLEAALAEYVAFATLPANRPTGEVVEAPGNRLPRKGMTAVQVDELLGEPLQSSERREGALRVVTRTYRLDDARVTAEFVEDVLFRYSMTSD